AIGELVGMQPRIATLDGDRRVFRTATDVIRTGVRRVYRLVTREGLALRLTADHRVATDRGDVPAEELVRGMRVRAVVTPTLDVPRDRLADLVGWGTVEALIPQGTEVVYDLVEPTTRHFFAEGLLVPNCGAQ